MSPTEKVEMGVYLFIGQTGRFWRPISACREGQKPANRGISNEPMKLGAIYSSPWPDAYMLTVSLVLG
jgi:hypothetical protein